MEPSGSDRLARMGVPRTGFWALRVTVPGWSGGRITWLSPSYPSSVSSASQITRPAWRAAWRTVRLPRPSYRRRRW